MRKTAHVFTRPLEFIGLDTPENKRMSASSFYKAQREVLPAVEDAFVYRFENGLKNQTKYTEKNPPPRTVVERRIHVPPNISVELHVGTQEKSVSYKTVLDNLETRLLDTIEEKRSGWRVPYVRTIGDELYIRLDVLPEMAYRWKKRKSGRSLFKRIIIEPAKRLYIKENNVNRLKLPDEISTETLEKVSLTFVDEDSFLMALSGDDEHEETLQLVSQEYLRGKEFSGSVYARTCAPFEKALKELARQRKTPWIELGDLLFHVPKVPTTRTRFDKIFNILFSDDIGNPGDFYLMLHADEFDEASKKMKEYGIKQRNGYLYIPIESVLERIRILRDSPEIKTKTYRWDPITSNPLYI